MREVQKYRYLMAGILTITVFVLGVLFSNFVDDTRYRELQEEMQENNIELESRQLQLSYLKSADVQSCSALEAGLEEIVKGYNDRLEKVQQYQENSFFKEDRFERVKQMYILSGIRYWMYAERLKDKCDYGADTILFFTEDMFEESECKDCKSLGSELTIIKRKYDSRLLIFSVPVGLDDGNVQMLKRQYNVTSTPSLVVNGDSKIEGFKTSRQIEQNLSVAD